jgi:hypothetical protein
VVQYETAIKTDKYVLVASGSSEDAVKAKAILDRTKADSLELHS